MGDPDFEYTDADGDWFEARRTVGEHGMVAALSMGDGNSPDMGTRPMIVVLLGLDEVVELRKVLGRLINRHRDGANECNQTTEE